VRAEPTGDARGPAVTSEMLIARHLIESAPRKRPRGQSLAASIVAHGGLISAAVVGTMHPHIAATAPSDPVAVIRMATLDPPPAAPPSTAAIRNPPPRGFQVLTAPADVPSTLPPPDALKLATVAENFTGRGIIGGIEGGVRSAAIGTHSSLNDPIDGTIADVPPYLLPGQMGASYPDSLRPSAPDGMVVARFVIDTLGHVESPSLRIVDATHPLFAESVRGALERLHFLPARFSGQRVRARLEVSFEFHMAR
jgi:protein TonB